LMMTGMEEQRARFQALSAFTGTGFTTREAEIVVNNPRRRHIVTWLMILGNAGIVTVIVGATSSVVTSQGYQLPISIVILLVGIYLIYKVMSHSGFTGRWERFIENRIIKSQAYEGHTTEDLFLLREDYGLVRVIVTPNSPLIGSSLSEAMLGDNELSVLGIERGKKWIPLPKTEETIGKGDRLVVYGHLPVLNRVFTKK
jgi:di/tricarboxylate transporter